MWFFLTPVVYFIATIPPEYQFLIQMNPMTWMLELFRAPIYYGTLPDLSTLLLGNWCGCFDSCRGLVEFCAFVEPFCLLPVVCRAKPMQSSIVLEDVHVHYRVHREQIRSFKEFVIRYAKRKLEYVDVHALSGITLRIQPGEVFGILGQNGAGKSTLMRVLAMVLPPTHGTVSVQGRIAPLLDLFSSFSTELTGTENIYLTGAILGLEKKEMQRRFDSIVDFAELREFIDAPMRTYSSGMMARLGFSVATSVDADILLVDEVLSVGDEQFQAKCQARINEYQRQGATIVLVSHSPDAVAQDVRSRALVR